MGISVVVTLFSLFFLSVLVSTCVDSLNVFIFFLKQKRFWPEVLLKTFMPGRHIADSPAFQPSLKFFSPGLGGRMINCT